jgi:hypothetical protein
MSRERFQKLARFVASEDREGDQGIQISHVTREAYTKMLGIYDGIVQPEFGDEFEEPNKLGSVRLFIEDTTRTILMMRAMMRGIKVRGGVDKIHMIEGGSGTGFLASVGALLDDRVSVHAFDYNEFKVAATKAFASGLGLGDRVVTAQRDLIRDPYLGKVDLLIAEQICRGLLKEHGSRLPRAFQSVDPQFVIPYAVTPVLFSGMDLEIAKEDDQDVFSGTIHSFSLRDPKIHKGQEIVLADSADPADFDVLARMILRPGFTPILVGNDVLWASPHLGEPLLHQTSEQFLRNLFDKLRSSPQAEDWENHLLGPTLLDSGMPSMADFLDPEFGDSPFFYTGFKNSASSDIEILYRVNYPFGLAGSFNHSDPGVQLIGCHNFDEVSLVRVRAQAFAGQ